MDRSKAACVRLLAAVACVAISLAAGAANALGQSNRVPLINQPLVPVGAVPGGAAFTLVVNGTGFVSGATVKWNGAALTTTFVTSSKLKAQVPAADIAAAGFATVTVTQPGTGGPTSNPVYFEIGTTVASLSLTRSDIPAGTNSKSMAAADLNGDGALDLIVANTDTSNFSVMLGMGNGTFHAQHTFNVPQAPGYLVIGDFNGDGKPDAAISSNGDVYIFGGHGDGSFSNATPFAMDAAGGPLVAGDFNGDGKLDVATTNSTLNKVAVLVNGVATDYAVGTGPQGIALGDFNRDGRLDLATANYASNTVSILLGRGDGTFRPGTNAKTTEGPIALAAADLNGDGKLDLIVATPGFSRTENVVTVLLGNGDGTFQTAVNYPVSGTPAGVVTGDFNNDGKLDVAVANQGSSALTVLLGNGDGTLQAASDQAAAGALDAVAIGDFNRDGNLDVAGSYAGGTSASVFLESGSGQSTAVLSPTTLNFPLTVVSMSSSPLPVTLSNTGTAPLSISSIVPTTQFSQTNNCGTSLPAGGSCTINVVFAPQHQGHQTGTLSVTDNAPGSPQTVALGGQATFFVVTPASLAFGNVSVGTTSAPQTISIYGEDGQPEKVTFSIAPSGDTSLFPYTDTCNGFVPSHAYCYVYISFAPTQTGLVSATFQINGGGGLTMVPVTGTGVSP